MGWIKDGVYDHEGWVANVLADGRVTGTATSGGVMVQATAADEAAGYEIRRYPAGPADAVIPWDQVVTWRVTCVCGWTGSEQPAHPTNDHGDRDCPEDLEDRVFHPEWRAHVAPYTALADLSELTDELHKLEQRIAETAQTARSAGASWSEIGRAAGMSKQGAQQRWGHD